MMNNLNTKLNKITDPKTNLEDLEYSNRWWNDELSEAKAAKKAAEQRVKTAESKIKELDGRIWEYHNLNQDQKHGLCAQCFNFGGDEWDNTFRLLFQHHPACQYIEHLQLRRQDFIKAYLQIEQQMIDRIKEQILSEKFSNLPAKISEALKEIEDDFAANLIKNINQAKGLIVGVDWGKPGGDFTTIFPDHALDPVATLGKMIRVSFDPNKEGREQIRAAAKAFLSKRMEKDNWEETRWADELTKFFIQHVDQFRPKYITKKEAEETPAFVGIDKARAETNPFMNFVGDPAAPSQNEPGMTPEQIIETFPDNEKVRIHTRADEFASSHRLFGEISDYHIRKALTEFAIEQIAEYFGEPNKAPACPVCHEQCLGYLAGNPCTNFINNCFVCQKPIFHGKARIAKVDPPGSDNWVDLHPECEKAYQKPFGVCGNCGAEIKENSDFSGNKNGLFCSEKCLDAFTPAENKKASDELNHNSIFSKCKEGGNPE